MSFKYNFTRDVKFFFTDFHRGEVNLLLHLISFVVLFIGLHQKNIIMIIVGAAVIDEFGHIYNFYLHKKDPKYGVVRMFPYQVLFGLPLLIILLKIFRLIPIV